MRIFVTGGSGFVGSAVIAELIHGGHEVNALARSAEAAEMLEAAGARAHRGDLEDFESLRAGAINSDGVIHCGFIHDFAKYKENCELDRRVIETFGAALAESEKPLVVTSGMILNFSGEMADEDDSPPPSDVNPRTASEEAARAVAKNQKIPVAVVRLAPSVHGIGDHGFVPLLIDLARRKKIAAYVGEGRNRWCAVHRFDAARLYRLAFEKLAANGGAAVGISYFHGVAEAEIPFKNIAEVIARGLAVPLESIAPEEAEAHFDWFARFAQLDVPGSSDKTRAELGWQPTEIGLLADIDRPEYFEN